MSGEGLARAAAGLIGVRFRLHGRDPATGLDCVGLVLAALRATGREAQLPACYALRNSDIGRALAHVPQLGLAAVAGAICAGDILLVESGPAQHHLLVALAENRFVHAHAGLRRVVTMPGPLPWPILQRWRLAPQEG